MPIRLDFVPAGIDVMNRVRVIGLIAMGVVPALLALEIKLARDSVKEAVWKEQK
jgi:hypothetical protein